MTLYELTAEYMQLLEWAEDPELDPEVLEEMAQEAPVGRNGTPMDVARAMEYLANANFVTGHVLNVDGGYVI